MLHRASHDSYVYIEYNKIHNLKNAGIFGAGSSPGNNHIWVTDNQFWDYQRQGGAGKAAIQTEGTTINGNTQWIIQRNAITNTTNPNGALGMDQVGIGLDQMTNSLIDNNTVIQSGFYLGAPNGGEGIVVNGYGNRITSNHVKGNQAGGISLLSYPGEASVHDVYVASNVLEGNGGTNPQGIAIVPWGGSWITNLLVENNQALKNNYGIQSYNPYGTGFTMTGTNNVVRNNDFSGNLRSGCSFVPLSGMILSNNIGC